MKDLHDLVAVREELSFPLQMQCNVTESQIKSGSECALRIGRILGRRSKALMLKSEDLPGVSTV